MKYHLCTACLYVLPIVYSHAAALEQSHQSVSAFLQENNYAEITLLYLEPNVSGQVQYQQQLRELGVTDFSTGDLVESKHFINAGLKLQLAHNFPLVYYSTNRLVGGLIINIPLKYMLKK
ncbi:MAG: hypothetical protein PHW70_01560 [Acinetobacter towneri]|nr:hypothetical protein [Acinetobacter towneri]